MFLAAMSSSRRDVVTQCVCVVVLLFPSLSPFSVLEVFSAFFLVLKSFNSVLKKFLGCLKFQWCFKEAFRVAKESVSSVQGSFKEVSRVFQG